ncbi:MAG TPA: hypothetical protein VKP30_24810, partial [Polyangiaceae bacterium]|nr:hypothetical protein [Polyangiaceae bacterium]
MPSNSRLKRRLLGTLLLACSCTRPPKSDVTAPPANRTVTAPPANRTVTAPTKTNLQEAATVNGAGRDARLNHQSGASSQNAASTSRDSLTASTSRDSLTASTSRDPLGAERIEPDGNDDAESEGSGAPPALAHFERVGRPPLSLRQICDLTPFGDALFAAHALAPLGSDGATISRFKPSEPKRVFAVAFDWNRPGEPAKGGGAGQGFLRIRSIAGRLYVPDADPPYNGLGLADWGTEGYVFVSRPDGGFAYATRPHFRPPARPTLDGRAGASVLPRAYHVFDVIRFRGQLIASTGSVPPKERAWYGPSPGALHVATADLSRFEYSIAYPIPYRGGVWRLTYLVRFRDRLYAGIQDYDGRSSHDYVIVSPPREAQSLAQEHLHPVRATPGGAAQTIRWYADQNRLYWIAWGHDGVHLRVTDDGDRWKLVELPLDAGA